MWEDRTYFSREASKKLCALDPLNFFSSHLSLFNFNGISVSTTFLKPCEMWWKLSTSACAVWRAGHADKGMARVKVVPVGFYVFSQYSGIFLLSGNCDNWSHTSLGNRWFLASSMDGEWLKGKVKKGCVKSEGNRVLR